MQDEFGGEWRQKNPAGETMEVMTPFHRLALAARNAAFKNEALKPKDIDSAVKESANKLTVWVTLRGTRPDFARFYTPAGTSIQAKGITPDIEVHQANVEQIDLPVVRSATIWVFGLPSP